MMQGTVLRFETVFKTNIFEKQIDQMVYRLYGLTEEEIDIVENFNK